MQISAQRIARIGPGQKKCSERTLVLANVTIKSKEQTVSIKRKDGKLYAITATKS